MVENRDKMPKHEKLEKVHGEILKWIDAGEVICPGAIVPECKDPGLCVFQVDTYNPQVTKRCNLYFIRYQAGDGLLPSGAVGVSNASVGTPKE